MGAKGRRSTDVVPPIPFEAVAELEEQLGRSLKGWDECPPLVCTGAPEVPGGWFDVAAVVRVVLVMRSLRHTKGKWGRAGGLPLEPEPWQVVWELAPVFGWKHPDGTRIVRTVWDELPRKNGKSTKASGIAWYLTAADGEPGAEVYAAASSLQQAKIVHEEAKKMGLASPDLRGLFKPLADVITYHNGNVFRVLSRIAEAAHGLNVHGGIVDEVHVHKRRDLIDAIETGTGAREQPLVWFITTADEATEGSIYDEKHNYTRKIAARIVADPSFYGVIWAAEDADDPFVEATWRKANPGYGVTISAEYLRKEAAKAKTTLSYYPTFCRLHLNRRMRDQNRLIDLRDWDATAGMVDLDKLDGRPAWGGFDLSAVVDFTAWWMGVQSVQPDVELEFFWRFYVPEDRVVDLERHLQVPLQRWIREGWVRQTEGNVIDYATVRDDALTDCRKVDIKRISYDRMFAGQMVQEIDAELKGVEVVPVAQTFMGTSPAIKELQRLLGVVDEKREAGRIRHGGNPVARWMASLVEAKNDGQDNLRLVKPERAKSQARIDGISACVTGLDGYLRRPMPKQRKLVVMTR